MGKEEEKGGSAAEPTCSGRGEDCEHFEFETKDMYNFLQTIKSLKCNPRCMDCSGEVTARNQRLQDPNSRFVMCSGCTQCFCTGLATNEDGPMGHARPHALTADHAIALWVDQPDASYCFRCGQSLCLEAITLAACSLERGYVVRGIPNLGNTCYVNALVQCFLALDQLWMSMLGTRAPRGPLGGALKELFVEARTGNDAGPKLNPKKLLEGVNALNKGYNARSQQDSQELLVHLRDCLIEEEKLERPPNMPEDVPTVFDSVFKGVVSDTLICKCCSHKNAKDVASYEFSLALPPPPDKHPTKCGLLSPTLTPDKHSTKNVTPPRRSGRPQRRKTSIKERREIKKGKSIQKVADGGDLEKAPDPLDLDKHKEDLSNSLPSIKDCLAHYFRKEVVERRCENCSKVPENPSTSRTKDGGQMVPSINGSTPANKDQTEPFRKADTDDLRSAHNNQIASTLNQDRTKQKELEKTVRQVGEGQNEQKDMGGHADKGLVLSKLPTVLTLHVLRFESNDKMLGHVEFEENLDVGTYMDRSSDEDDARYRLVGVIEHIGRSILGGHFVAYVRGSRPESQQQQSSGSSPWFRASDSSVREVSLGEVLKCEAYLLFYERI